MPNILIVDDDSAYGRLVGSWMSAAGYTAETLTTPLGISARLLAAPAVDAIVLDCMMPALTGPAVLQLLSRSNRFKDIPVVLMSAVATDDNAEAARLHGHAVFVEKSGRRDALLEQLDALLSTSGSAQQAPGDDQQDG